MTATLRLLAAAFPLLAWSPAFAQTICHDPPAGMSCPGDRLVWCNTPSGVYHFQGERYFGYTKAGKFAKDEEQTEMMKRRCSYSVSGWTISRLTQ